MRTVRPLILIVPTVLIACAQAVSQDFVDDESEGASGPGAGGTTVSDGGKTNGTGGKTGSMPTAGKGGMGTQAFGGTSTNGGGTDEGQGGEDTGGTGGAGTAGSGGAASGGGGGKSSGGSAGTGGTGGSSGSGGGGGTGQVGEGDCAGTPVFEAGAAMKYGKNALVVAVCMGGTTCTQEMPPLTQGKQYEFKCLDEYNCGRADTNPATTNWATPCWKVTRACE
jgi:hypothetical protein